MEEITSKPDEIFVIQVHIVKENNIKSNKLRSYNAGKALGERLTINFITDILWYGVNESRARSDHKK